MLARRDLRCLPRPVPLVFEGREVRAQTECRTQFLLSEAQSFQSHVPSDLYPRVRKSVKKNGGKRVVVRGVPATGSPGSAVRTRDVTLVMSAASPNHHDHFALATAIELAEKNALPTAE
jgi:hypothetical protein